MLTLNVSVVCLRQISITGIRFTPELMRDDSLREGASAAFSSFVDTLLACAPNLKTLQLGHVKKWDESSENDPALTITAAAKELQTLVLERFAVTATSFQAMEAPKLQSLRILAEARGWRMNTTPHQSLRDEAGKSIKDAIQALFPSAKINAPLPKEDQE